MFALVSQKLKKVEEYWHVPYGPWHSTNGCLWKFCKQLPVDVRDRPPPSSPDPVCWNKEMKMHYVICSKCKEKHFCSPRLQYCEIYLQFKITVFYFNILKDVIYFCDAKLNSVLRLQDYYLIKKLTLND